MTNLTPQRRWTVVLIGACAAIITAAALLGYQDARIGNHSDGLLGVAIGIGTGVALIALRKSRASNL
jgi:ABC-type Mn2+/Zn2+ transport system permease subunit